MAARRKRGTGFAGAAAAVVVSVALVFVLANAGAWIAFRLFADRFVPANIRTTYDFFARYDGALAQYREDWFGLPPGGWPQYVAETKERIARGGNTYEDFTMFKPVPSRGEHVNFLEDGYRSIGADLQGPWPVDPKNLNVFFFGGSTAMGVGSDRATIARFLQQRLQERAPPGRSVKVYNFGRGSYFSTQDLILFEALLRAGARPDIAVFLHGLNDLFFLDGRPSAWSVFDLALSDHARVVREQVAGALELRPRWRSLLDFVQSLPLVKLASAIGAGGEAPVGAYKPVETDVALLRQAVQRYRATLRNIQAVADGFRVKAAFVIQPVPGYNYDLTRHIALDPRFGLGGHERSGQGYPLLRASLEQEPVEGAQVIWAADLQRDYSGTVYLDAVHYTRGFSEALAGFIAAEIADRGLFD